MKKFALLFILVAGFAVAHAQQAPAAAKAENNGPVMYLSTTTVDFGTIEQDSEPYRKLPFENRGNSPLIITNAKEVVAVRCRRGPKNRSCREQRTP